MGELSELRKSIGKLEKELDELKGKLNSVEEKNRDLESTIAQRYPSPVMHLAEDIAMVEGIIDMLVCHRIVTVAEVHSYIDTYKQSWTALVHLMIDKKVITQKELNISILAFHHMIRVKGTKPDATYEELQRERIKFAEDLGKLSDPLNMW